MAGGVRIKGLGELDGCQSRPDSVRGQFLASDSLSKPAKPACRPPFLVLVLLLLLPPRQLPNRIPSTTRPPPPSGSTPFLPV
ncbi:uncharacterized protein BO80DRAFT_430090, partial [Aspergillus ibericus CBS 121593]